MLSSYPAMAPTPSAIFPNPQGRWEINKVVAGKIPITVDGDLKRGADILKELPIGAQAVGLGRPILYGLAVGDEKGVKTVFIEISEELKRVMMMGA